MELIPGIGKKTMWTILEERRKKPFESFEDIRNRSKAPDPVVAITERIVRELRGEERYYLFVDPPPHVSGAVFLNYLDKIYRELERRG